MSVEPLPICPECGTEGTRVSEDRPGTHYQCPACRALWGVAKQPQGAERVSGPPWAASGAIVYHHTSAEVRALERMPMPETPKPPLETKEPPPLTALDWQIIIQAAVTLVTMGVTVIEVHPVRWGLILAAAMRYGGPMFAGIEPDANGEVTAIPLGFMLAGKPVRAVLRRWEPCDEKGCEACSEIEAQAGNYPVPEEPSPIILPPGTPRGRPS